MRYRDCPEGFAPVQGEASNDKHFPGKPAGMVEWDEHVKAWEAYHRKHDQQSAERIAERGGFGYNEMYILLGYEPQTWRLRRAAY